VAGTTDPVAGTTDPVAGTTDPVAGRADPVLDTAAGTTDSVAGTADPVVGRADPVRDTAAGTTDPVAGTADPVAGATAPALGARALIAFDPTLANRSLLLGTALTAPGPGARTAAGAHPSESRPAPGFPESPARSDLSGGGPSPFGGGFSLSLLALLLLMALADIALLSERLIVASAPWRSVALVTFLKRPG
jgi:hypothetical protein